MKFSTYNQIRKAREFILEEIRNQFGGSITLEHYILAEHRLHSLIMAGFDDNDIGKERDNFKKKI